VGDRLALFKIRQMNLPNSYKTFLDDNTINIVLSFIIINVVVVVVVIVVVVVAAAAAAGAVFCCCDFVLDLR